MSTSVEYLGYKIDATGLHTTQKKIEAIQQAPNPENIQQLRSFLGLVHHYGKFIPNLATITERLNQLLHKDTPWAWSKTCDTAFVKLKDILSSSPVLVHYDTNSPLRLAWNWSCHLTHHARSVRKADCFCFTYLYQGRAQLFTVGQRSTVHYLWSKEIPSVLVWQKVHTSY